MGFEILLTVLAEESRTETDYDEHGVKTIVEYRTDEQGRRVKVGGRCSARFMLIVF